MDISVPLPASGPPQFYRELLSHFPRHGALAGPVASLKCVIMGWKGIIEHFSEESEEFSEALLSTVAL